MNYQKQKWSAFQTFRLAMEWEEGDWSSLVATDLDLVVANVANFIWIMRMQFCPL